MTETERAQRLTAAFRTIHQQLLPPYVLQGEGAILELLLSREDGMLSGELSRELGVSKGRISNTLKILERKGWLTRTAGLMDARQVHVRLTGAGAARAREQYTALIDSTIRLLSGLGQEDADELLRLVEELAGTKQTNNII